jgi:hypothetical protein
MLHATVIVASRHLSASLAFPVSVGLQQYVGKTTRAHLVRIDIPDLQYSHVMKWTQSTGAKWLEKLGCQTRFALVCGSWRLDFPS